MLIPCCRAHGQCERELCQIQRGLLRQHGDEFYAQSQPREPGNGGEGKNMFILESKMLVVTKGRKKLWQMNKDDKSDDKSLYHKVVLFIFN